VNFIVCVSNAASTRSLNCFTFLIFIFAFLSCLPARRGASSRQHLSRCGQVVGRGVPPSRGLSRRNPKGVGGLKSWGRYRSGTSPESHTPQYSSQDSEDLREVEKPPTIRFSPYFQG